MLTNVCNCLAACRSYDMAWCNGLQRNMQKLFEGLYVQLLMFQFVYIAIGCRIHNIISANVFFKQHFALTNLTLNFVILYGLQTQLEL